MPLPYRRGLPRYPCDLPVDVHAFISGGLVTRGRFRDMSVGGTMLHCADPLSRGVTYFFRFHWKETPLEFPGRVAWAAPRDPKNPEARRYGVQLNLTRDQEQFLRGMVESLRLSAPPPAARRVQRDYWERRA